MPFYKYSGSYVTARMLGILFNHITQNNTVTSEQSKR